jgi:hypothetical protein
MSTLDSVFWISFVTIASGMIIKLASLCFKSKCKECELCGGRIRVVRDIDAERQERQFEITHQQNESRETNL